MLVAGVVATLIFSEGDSIRTDSVRPPDTAFVFIVVPLAAGATVFRAAPHTVVGAKCCVTAGAIELLASWFGICAHVATSPKLKTRWTAIISLVVMREEEEKEAQG